MLTQVAGNPHDLHSARFTDNFALAVALATIGVPLIEIWNELNEAQMKAGGWATIHQAAQDGAQGTLIFGFSDHPDRDEFWEAFRQAQTEQGESSTEIPDVVKIDGCDTRLMPILGMLVGKLCRNYEKMVARCKASPPKLRVQTGENTFAVAGKDATPEQLQRIGIQ